jgi:hypothetical protein
VDTQPYIVFPEQINGMVMSESKNESHSQPENPPVQEKNSIIRTYIGMFWLLWGNIILVSMAIKITQKQTFLSVYDLIYWVNVILLAILRYCDIKYFKGITATGSQATMVHWRKYITYLLLVSAALWIFANGLTS